MPTQTQVPGLGPTLRDADAELALLAIGRGKRMQLSASLPMPGDHLPSSGCGPPGTF